MERSAEFYRGAKWMALECGEPLAASKMSQLLAEAETREASVPTAANGAGTLTLSETIAGLREACAGVVVSKREVLTAEEVIAAAEKAFARILYDHTEFDDMEREAKYQLVAIARWKEANGV